MRLRWLQWRRRRRRRRHEPTHRCDEPLPEFSFEWAVGILRGTGYHITGPPEARRTEFGLLQAPAGRGSLQRCAAECVHDWCETIVGLSALLGSLEACRRSCGSCAAAAAWLPAGQRIAATAHPQQFSASLTSLLSGRCC